MTIREEQRSASYGGLGARREAGPVSWEVLTGDQQAAAERALRLVFDLASKPWPPRDDGVPRQGWGEFLPTLDRARYNQTVLIDGGRGTGKTVVLLSVLDYLTSRLLPRKTVGRNGPEHPVEATLSDAQRHALVVPVGIIDLQPLPRYTELTMFVAGFFERVVRALEHSARGSAPTDGAEAPVWSPHAVRPLGSRQRWKRFRDSVALATSYLERRKEHLDTSTYSVELEESHLRMELRASFADFVDGLASEFSRSALAAGVSGVPYFLVVIDDADMNPRYSARLLEVVQILAHPRVGYLMTGHTELFRMMLRLRLAGELRSPLEQIDLEPADLRYIEDFAKLETLATDAYNKLIPPHHRCALRTLTGAKRHMLLFEPGAGEAGLETGLETGLDPLHGAMAGVQVWRERLPAERSHAESSGDAPTRASRLSDYFAETRLTRLALPETLRAVRDLDQAVFETGVPTADAPGANTVVTELVHRLWRESLEGAPGGLDAVREVVRLHHTPAENAVAARPADGAMLVVDASAIEAVPLHRPLLSGGKTASPGQVEEFKASFALRQIIGYSFRVQPLAGDTRRAPAALSDRAGAALVLATDLAADVVNGLFIDASPAPDEFTHDLVTVTHTPGALREGFRISWPLPDWGAFSDVHMVSDELARMVDALQQTLRTRREYGEDDIALDADADSLARSVLGKLERRYVPGRVKARASILDFLALPFLAIVADAAWSRKFGYCWNPTVVRRTGMSRPGDIAAEIDPQRLRERLREIREFPVRFTRDSDNRRWIATRAPLLAAPESGLSDAMARVVFHLTTGSDAPFDPGARRAVEAVPPDASGTPYGERAPFAEGTFAHALMQARELRVRRSLEGLRRRRPWVLEQLFGSRPERIDLRDTIAGIVAEFDAKSRPYSDHWYQWLGQTGAGERHAAAPGPRRRTPRR